IESNHTINIEAFVDADEVDVVYEDAPYYLAPDGAMAEETFVVLREAMRKTNKVGVGRLVMSSRERVVTIGPRDNGMLISTLRNPSEVRATSDYFDAIPADGADPEMLELAEKLIEQKVKPFDPKDYPDRYEAALMAMIKEKLKGHKPIIAAAPERGNVINLMDALKQSLGQAKPPAQSKSKGEAAARKTPIKPSLKEAVEASKAASVKAGKATKTASGGASTRARKKA
ncbi:MAG TPA: Ku protein, partial [Alphaproteobacteria bacterium]|nr:Ku protein [Alphaproteobacteria bacterium]